MKKDYKNTGKPNIPAGKDDTGRIKKLELELEAVNEALQGLVKRIEISNSELQSLNKEITELKNAKTELSRSEKLMESIFHTADIGIAIVDSKGLFVKVNDGLSKLLGFKQNELAGKPYLEIIAPSEKKETKLLQKQFLAGQIKNYKNKIITKDGNIIDTYIDNNLYIDTEGNKFLVKTIRDISESEKYKDLLQEAVKAVHMGGYEFEIPSNKLIWTDEMYRIFEVKDDFIPTVGKVTSLFTKESMNIIQRLTNDALRHGKNFDAELELVTTGKNRKWVRITGTVKKIKSRIIKLVGTVQDITIRKETELQLQRLSLVASKTNNAVIIADAFGKTEWVNESFTRMTGYEMKEAVGKTPGEILQGEETDKTCVKKISARLKKLLPVTEVLKNYRKDGSAFWINIDITPVFKEGELINFIGLGVDITELIEAKEAQKTKETLEQQQQLFNAIAKNFPDGIIGVLDKNFNYVFADGSEIKKLGLTRDHLIGKHIFNALSKQSNSAAEPFLQKAFAGENVLFEIEMHHRNYTINAVPLIANEKGVEKILVVLYNITKRKKAEEEVWQALTKQKELNELKSKFVSIASHEFRTPLSGILSSVFLVSKYSELHDIEKTQKHVDRITASVHTLTEILNYFLSLGKIEDGKIQNNPSDFDIVEFCENLTDEIKPTLKKDQSIIYHHEGENKIISLDIQQLKHVLINLLSNAVKYSAEGKSIWLTSTSTHKQILFTIKDEGIGIPKEDQPHLFQTFFRGNNVSHIQGTGMGLHIVKKFLDIMGGSIQFSSIQDAGTTFSLQFPSEHGGPTHP